MAEFGYTGKILKVALPQGSISELRTSDYADRFIGGRGIAAKIYWDEVPPETKAFDPENALVFMTGPLAGLPSLSGSRWQICGKSPVTNPETFCYANLGGSWGAFLKFAGYDGIVIQGISDRLVYLFVNNGNVEIKDGTFLAGKSTIQTQELLKGIHGRDTRVAAIGPAGENLVSNAIVLADEDSAGSAGFGAVMGSKRIKAIAVKGTNKVSAANPDRLNELRGYVRSLKKDAPGIIPCGIRASILENQKMRKVACRDCIAGCMRMVYEAEDGKKGKFMCQPVALYPDLAMKYYGKETDGPFYAARFCDEYGITSHPVRAFLMWLKRCFRAGVLNDESTGMPLTKLGRLEFIEALVRKISLREGFGDILARGIFEAAHIIGGKAEELLGWEIHKAGHHYQYSPKLYISTGILYAIEPRMSMAQLHEVSLLMHQWLDWYNQLEGAFVSTEVLRGITKRFFGSEITFDFSTYQGKAAAAQRIQDREYAKECLILCDFSWPIMSVRSSKDHIGDPAVESKILSAVIGKDIDEEGLYHIGQRVFNLQRAIFIREGYKGRISDTLPETDYTVPFKMDYSNPEGILPGHAEEVISRKGQVVDKEKFEEVKDEYYKLRGWDISTGLQTKVQLGELELHEVAEELETRGLLAR
jgi:aldehyde:ferredoxin oxidoreductase